MKISDILCLDHFYIMVSPEQFSELKKLKNKVSGFSHSKMVTKDESWEGCYWGTNSGEYIEFMQPKVGSYEGLGVALSTRSPIYADVRELKNEFKKLPWDEGTRVWPDKTKWFTWLALKSKKSAKKINSFISIWSMFYHPRYHQYKDTLKKPVPNVVDRIIQLDVVMNPELRDLIIYHLRWTPAVIKSASTKMSISIPNRQFVPFIININFKKSCPGVIFKKIICETHRMKKIKLPKLKTISFTQKDGVLVIKNNQI